MRAFVRRPGASAKQELNQSPLAFVETPYQTDSQQALARKDAIIRVRNAQVPIASNFSLAFDAWSLSTREVRHRELLQYTQNTTPMGIGTATCCKSCRAQHRPDCFSQLQQCGLLQQSCIAVSLMRFIAVL